MKTRTLKSDFLLIASALIWGFAFVAQRIGMEHVGPFFFNGVRFALGGAALVPVMMLRRRRGREVPGALPLFSLRMLLLGGGLAGLTVFAGASLQQTGLVYTTAGKAGFITGLYVVIVPVMGAVFRQTSSAGIWAGAVSAVVGLYFLSITGDFHISLGDSLVLLGAFFWAAHVHIIDRLSPLTDPIRLAFLQFTACSLVSLVTAILVEEIGLDPMIDTLVPILYAGLLSVGIAYTLQVVAQREAHPGHAAVILSTEAVFAALGGWLVIGETLTPRGLFGCALMLFGMILSQLSARPVPDAAA